MKEVVQMKWWGWGHEEMAFSEEIRPNVWPFTVRVLKIEGPVKIKKAVRLEDITLPPCQIHTKVLEKLTSIVGEKNITSDHEQRVLHSYGKSYRDLFRIRRGIVESSPDLILYPRTTEEVAQIIQLLNSQSINVIAYGGGSNVVGGVEVKDTRGRPTVCIDMKRMNKVLKVDAYSNLAVIEAGVRGPDLEEQLKSHQMTLGHFPDSFQFSTLGGWIATRSAGMQSDKYGKIEKIVVSLKMVTPEGIIETLTVPAASSGIDLNYLCIGSEGVIGIITEATMKVHRLPEVKKYYGYFFPDFESGVKAIHECVAAEITPVITRFNDPMKTQLSMAFGSHKGKLETIASNIVKWILKRIKKFDFDRMCMMLVVFEGNAQQVSHQYKQVNKIYKKYGAFNIGQSPGKTFEQTKYDFPYLRDYMMERSIVADASETSTTWSNLLNLYNVTIKNAHDKADSLGATMVMGCHISHTYHTGACLYFTWASPEIQGRELEQYLEIKKSTEDSFLANGGTLSHHHATGYEHMPWVQAELSETGLKALGAIKKGLDPNSIMNPGKLMPSEGNPLESWGLKNQ